MKSIFVKKARIYRSVIIFAATSTPVLAQGSASAAQGQSYSLYLFMIAVIFLATAALLIWKRKNAPVSNAYDYDNRLRSKDSDSADETVDITKELEWFRKAKNPNKRKPIARNSGIVRERKAKIAERAMDTGEMMEARLNSKEFQEKMKRHQYAALPINSFLKMTDARSYQPLPVSDDADLLTAIDQANEEFEEDEVVRELAVRVLAAFRNQNSVDALNEIALYDLSANVRSKAVNALTEFDHESVFESILLACADPTREVRAAAARGLFRLSFDRAEAWKRIMASGDIFRIRHAARAATESGIAQRSFDRLIHEDMRIAYEAVAMVGVLIAAGENDQIVDALQRNGNHNTKLALLHVIKLVKDEEMIKILSKMHTSSSLSGEISEKVSEIIAEFETAKV